ncbi:MAG TPA: S41 family peptidase [Usitatibacteraceae bacterium]|nr:S41 family peptidase [Usitatibacteraceae bacterium]HRA23229.1 S41 family peptidase [Usitatibacteraceae bacterium]
MRSRRRFLRDALALVAAGPGLARAAAEAPAGARDFDALWGAIDRDYAYLERGHDWRGARERWRPRAAQAHTREALVAALEGALAELNDEHVTLDAHLPGSARPVPMATDLWAHWVGKDAVVAAVRAGSVADVAGAVPGMRVLAIQGAPVDQAVRKLLRRSRQADPRARDWALRRLLAGPWAGVLALDVSIGARARTLEIAREDVPPAGTPPLIARRIGEDRALAYLRVKDNLGQPGVVQHFDAALQQMRASRGLVLDLRETQSGGSPEVAKALLGRFVTAESPWIVRVPRAVAAAGEIPAERVSPRGPFAYTGRTLVLVDRWTAGEAESLAVGLEAAARATLVGTPMAGLRGQSRELRLPASGIVLRYPALRVFHANGTPREVVRPAVPVDIVAPSGGPGDPILYQALKLLEVA